jgi:hypothetical protein
MLNEKVIIRNKCRCSASPVRDKRQRMREING